MTRRERVLAMSGGGGVKFATRRESALSAPGKQAYLPQCSSLPPSRNFFHEFFDNRALLRRERINICCAFFHLCKLILLFRIL